MKNKDQNKTEYQQRIFDGMAEQNRKFSPEISHFKKILRIYGVSGSIMSTALMFLYETYRPKQRSLLKRSLLYSGALAIGFFCGVFTGVAKNPSKNTYVSVNCRIVNNLKPLINSPRETEQDEKLYQKLQATLVECSLLGIDSSDNFGSQNEFLDSDFSESSFETESDFSSDKNEGISKRF